jgi:Uma2 family endonuclease
MGVTLHKLSLAEYLAWEDEQADRHEFWRGEVFAMVGAKRGHGRVIANLMRHLGNHLDDTPCQAFSENMKVQVGDDGLWNLLDMSDGPLIELATVNARIALDAVFKGMESA